MLTQERLKELLKYDMDTGIFTWIVSRGSVSAGSTTSAVTNSCGYLHIQIDGMKRSAHRLAFLYMEGYLPEHQVDHKNGIKHDNRWNNLRHATNSCNSQNQTISSNNTSGFPGVTFRGNNKWSARVSVYKNHMCLGTYVTALDAALARLTWEVQCPEWTCNHRGELIKAIKQSWSEFNDRCL